MGVGRGGVGAGEQVRRCDIIRLPAIIQSSLQSVSAGRAARPPARPSYVIPFSNYIASAPVAALPEFPYFIYIVFLEKHTISSIDRYLTTNTAIFVPINVVPSASEEREENA